MTEMVDTITKLIEARLVSLLILVALGFALWHLARVVAPAIAAHYKAREQLIADQAATLKAQHEAATATLLQQLEASHKERREELAVFRQALSEHRAHSEQRDAMHRMELGKRDELNTSLLAELRRMSRAMEKVSERLDRNQRASSTH